MLPLAWQIDGMPVYGVAIPTVEGIRNVLHMVGATREASGRRVLWHNMREEPVSFKPPSTQHVPSQVHSKPKLPTGPLTARPSFPKAPL